MEIRENLLSQEDIIKMLAEKEVSLKHLQVSQIMNCVFEKEKVYGHQNQDYILKFNKLFNDALNAYPKIKTFSNVFDVAAEEKWNEYRLENQDKYANIFGKITAQLRCEENYQKAVWRLNFLSEVRAILEDKYDDLCDAMIEYHRIYHSNEENKLSNVEKSKDTIASLSALYISKSKDNYKKNIKEEFSELLKPYFKVRLENNDVSKKIILIRQKNEFKKLYEAGNSEVKKFLISLVKKYSAEISEEILWEMINSFILKDNSKIHNIIVMPYKYLNYEKYEKASKLINRLNQGFITFDDVEVKNYQNIICFDKVENKYYYIGPKFNESDLDNFKIYRKYAKVFGKLKRDLMFAVSVIDVKDLINEQVLLKAKDEFAFNDDYFVFDDNYVLNKFNFRNFFKSCLTGKKGFNEESFLVDSSYELLYFLFINNGLIWLLLFMRQSDNLIKQTSISSKKIMQIIDNMAKITKLSESLNIDASNYQNILLLNDISDYASMQTIAILGLDVIKKLCESKDYTHESQGIIVKKAEQLASLMLKKDMSTVPYISGSNKTYNYFLYDAQDESIFCAGIDTDACFKVDGTDNDFFHYCALDKNGFVIKITDNTGNFIARAAGFRHGNCVFINQLRTIYDCQGNFYFGDYDSERNEIIDAFKSACEDILCASQSNYKEKEKIDFVFVTKSYSMKYYNSSILVTQDAKEKIGDKPMDNESEDWNNFLGSSENLEESYGFGYFATDYGEYDLICMASIKNEEEIVADDILLKDVPALYERKRNKIIVTKKIEDNILKKLNKIVAVKSLLHNLDFTPLQVPNNSTIFLGDNWFIIYNDGGITCSCILDFDSNAINEFKAAKEVIGESENLTFEQITNIIYYQKAERTLKK